MPGMRVHLGPDGAAVTAELEEEVSEPLGVDLVLTPLGVVIRLGDAVDEVGLVDRPGPVDDALPTAISARAQRAERRREHVVGKCQHRPPRTALGRSTSRAPGFTPAAS